MKKAPKLALLVLAAVLVGMQFFQPERLPSLDEPPADDLLLHLEAPVRVAELISSSCYDCHSVQVNYPWYSRIAPFSHYLDKHIRMGLEGVNFSEFASEKKLKQMSILNSIGEVVDDGSMPLQSYLLIHGEARLSQEDKDLLVDWSSTEAEALLKK